MRKDVFKSLFTKADGTGTINLEVSWALRQSAAGGRAVKEGKT